MRTNRDTLCEVISMCREFSQVDECKLTSGWFSSSSICRRSVISLEVNNYCSFLRVINLIRSKVLNHPWWRHENIVTIGGGML